MEFSARYFDGAAPVGRSVVVTLEPEGLHHSDDASKDIWPYEEIEQTRGDRAGEPVHLERRGHSGVLVFGDPAILPALRTAAPQLAARIRPASHAPFLIRVALILGALAATVAVLFLWVIPGIAVQVARRVPTAWEESFGQAVMEQLAPRARRLEDPRVVEPVRSIVDRLAATLKHRPYVFRVTVLEEAEVNAFAAPGGYIAINTGLLTFARTPDEVAAVLAHEMQHVMERHVTEAMFKQLSLAALVRMVAGDGSDLSSLSLQAAGKLGQLSYDRAFERAADDGAFDMLAAAGVDPEALPVVLTRMDKGHGSPAVVEFLSTHPGSAERAGRLRARSAPVLAADRAPLLETERWDDLQAALKGVGGGAAQTP